MRGECERAETWPRQTQQNARANRAAARSTERSQKSHRKVGAASTLDIRGQIPEGRQAALENGRRKFGKKAKKRGLPRPLTGARAGRAGGRMIKLFSVKARAPPRGGRAASERAFCWAPAPRAPPAGSPSSRRPLPPPVADWHSSPPLSSGRRISRRRRRRRRAPESRSRRPASCGCRRVRAPPRRRARRQPPGARWPPPGAAGAEAAARARAPPARSPPPHAAAAQKIKTDLSELNLPSHITINFPDGADKIMHFEITIMPRDGMYRRVSSPPPFVFCPVFWLRPPAVAAFAAPPTAAPGPPPPLPLKLKQLSFQAGPAGASAG